MNELVLAVVIIPVLTIIFILIAVLTYKKAVWFLRKSEVFNAIIIENIRDGEGGRLPKIEFYDSSGRKHQSILNKSKPFGYKIGKEVSIRGIKKGEDYQCKFNTKYDLYVYPITFSIHAILSILVNVLVILEYLDH